MSQDLAVRLFSEKVETEGDWISETTKSSVSEIIDERGLMNGD